MEIKNHESGRISMKTEHGEAELLYRIHGNVMSIYHTFTPPDDRGSGVAAKLAEKAFGLAKEKGLKVRPDCPYIGHFVEKRNEFKSQLV